MPEIDSIFLRHSSVNTEVASDNSTCSTKGTGALGISDTESTDNNENGGNFESVHSTSSDGVNL